jgi:hypothetical protein
MFRIILMIFLFLWLVLFFGISFFSWGIRKKIMAKFAAVKELKFIDNKTDFRLEGFYKDKNVIIKEFKPSKNIFKRIRPVELGDQDAVFRFGIDEVSLGRMTGRFRNISKIVIKVDDKKIYDKQKEVLFMPPNKIKKMLDKHINKIVNN